MYWLPSYCTWFQDHMRKAGDVCFAEVSRDSDGIFWNASLQIYIK